MRLLTSSNRLLLALMISLLQASFPHTTGAQTIEWIRQFGSAASDGASSVAVTPEGTYVVGGTAGVLAGQSNSGGFDAFVIKYDAVGNVVWTRQFGTNFHDSGYDVAVDSTGVYVVGGTDGVLPGYANTGTTDVFVRK